MTLFPIIKCMYLVLIKRTVCEVNEIKTHNIRLLTFYSKKVLKYAKIFIKLLFYCEKYIIFVAKRFFNPYFFIFFCKSIFIYPLNYLNMKKLLRLLALCVFLSYFIPTNAQLINCNPDPNGEPWWAGGVPPITPERQAELDAIPQFVFSPQSYATSLPYKINNSEHIWFSDIFNQRGASCAQASGVAYIFTYEVNRVRNVPADVPENQYPTHFTWNFFNKGTDTIGSWVTGGWQIIKEIGVPTVADYGGLWMNIPNNYMVWMSGYEKYLKALDNRVIEDYYQIDISTPEGLNNLKHWLVDHGEGARSGGLASFSCNITEGEVYGYLPPQSEDPGKKVLLKFGTDGGHAMTIVGYNDNIKFDFNGDGQFTNPGNNMNEWEMGAFIVANSWGQWANQGFIYVPYRLISSMWGRVVHVMKVKPEYSPELVLKTQVGYPCRNRLILGAGYAENANSPHPSSQHQYSAFKYKRGGCLPMQGVNNNPIELGLDYNQRPEYNTSGKVYFIVNEDDPNGDYEGVIPYFSLFDYRWGEAFELPCDSSNVSIVNNGNTMVAIDYHLLPHLQDISDDLTLNSNRVSRFTTQVTNHSLLEVNTGVQTDMYNSTIHISEGSTFV